MSSPQNDLDIVLAYKALGSSVSDTPAQLEEKYQRLIRKCKVESKSQDAQVREEARQQLLFFEEMYGKIKESVTYSAVVKEERKRAESAPQGQSRNIKGYLTHCPSCNALISKGLKKCPVCKTDFTTKMERIAGRYFTPGNVAALVVLLVVAALVALALIFPDDVAILKKQIGG